MGIVILSSLLAHLYTHTHTHTHTPHPGTTSLKRTEKCKTSHELLCHLSLSCSIIKPKGQEIDKGEYAFLSLQTLGSFIHLSMGCLPVSGAMHGTLQ